MSFPFPIRCHRVRHDEQIIDRLRQWLRNSGLRPAKSYRHAIDLCDLARDEIGSTIHSEAMAEAALLEGFPVRRWRSRPALIGVSESSYQDVLAEEQSRCRRTKRAS